ncbi:MAG UNVERIFIED_CONTAM: DUF1501 domain-containing protein [Planctomycetaceae bacterium]|jgi:hypothetical protein
MSISLLGKFLRGVNLLGWWWGGPSQLETFDPKPEAPSEYRGPFGSIRTKVPGLDICEIFPGLAKVADRYSLIRSVRHGDVCDTMMDRLRC